MKSNTLFFKLICAGLVVLSIVGVFDEQAFQFLKGIAQKNTAFLATVTEIKMLIAGISSINLPFVSGHTTGIEDSLSKVQNYLLFTDIITFVQILFISLSKSLVFKALLVALFVLSFFDKSKKTFTKILIVALALSPGISIYTVAVKHISETTRIDFGEAYLSKLQASSAAIKAESTELMKQHSKEQTEIRNGKKHPSLMKRFEEDVSYDIKKVGTLIKGDFVQIRTLIRSAGEEVLTKVFRFCTMILFGMLILPLGYFMLIKMLIESLFKNSSLEAVIADIGVDKTQKLKLDIHRTSFLKKLGNIWRAIRQEFTTIENKIEHSKEFQALYQKIEQSENRIKDELKSTVQKKEQQLQGDVRAEEQKVSNAAKQEVNKVKSNIAAEVSDLKSDANDQINEVKSQVDETVSDLSNKAKADLAEGKAKVEDTVQGAEQKVNQLKSDVVTEALDLKSDANDQIGEAKSKVDETVSNLSNKTKVDLTKVEDKVQGTEQKVKGTFHKKVREVSNKTNDIVARGESIVSNAETEVSAEDSYIELKGKKLSAEVIDKANKVKTDAGQIEKEIQKPKKGGDSRISM